MPVEFQDDYATLGVGREATGEEIKKAFRMQAKKNHPDTAKGKEAAGERDLWEKLGRISRFSPREDS
ncbi:MAG: DnaJ domain-containing protein [Trueperaceae bacterium]|nr:DnaJ domain-containing protein [Trueperaceae bacterium]